MKLSEIGSLNTKDAITDENSFIIIKIADEAVGFGLSLETNGDVEVYLR